MSKLNYGDISNIFQKNGIQTREYFLGDFNYLLPNKVWFFNEFTASLDSLLTFLKTKEYKNESNDCDDFARAGAFLAQTLHSRTSPDSNSGLLIGEFWYRRDDNVPHAINFAIVNEYNEYKLVFLEPQNGKELILSETEKKSCVFWRL